MEKLLKWSIDAAKDPSNAGQPDPKLLEQLFGTGMDDHTSMKISLRTAVESEDQDLRIESLEVFEELIENIDNANNIGNLWEPLIYLVNDHNPKIRQLALSTVGSAVQNNDKAQKDLVTTGSGIPTVLEHMLDKDELTASKAVYALTSAVGHCPEAYDLFKANGGWEGLTYIFDKLDPSGQFTKPQLRSLSLLYALTLLEPRRPILEELQKSSVINDLTTIYPVTNEQIKERLNDIFEVLSDHGYKFIRPVKSV